MAKLKYRVATCNVFWCENEIDTRFFEDIESQNSYFDLLTSGRFSPLVNFNIGDNIETTIVFTDKTEDSIEDILRRNYCVIQKCEVNEDEEEIIERRYFFIQDIRQDSGRQVIIDISLDDIQTNYFRVKNSIADCFINRACLERFKKVNNTNVRFFNDEDSPLHNNEPVNASQTRLVERTKIRNSYRIENDWFNNNVAYWLYIYVSRSSDNRKYNFYEYSETDLGIKEVVLPHSHYIGFESGTKLPNDFDILCIPIYKTDKRIYCSYDFGGIKYVEMTQSLEWFKANNNDTSFIYSIKVSIIPPTIIGSEYLVGENGHLYIKSFTNLPSTSNQNYANYGDVDMLIQHKYYRTGIGYTLYGMFVIINDINQKNGYFENKYNLPIFTKDELKGIRNIKYEPKLLTNGNNYIRLCDTQGNSYNYDTFKICPTNGALYIELDESLTSDITRYYLRLIPPNQTSNYKPFYIKDISTNLTGLVGSYDSSLILCNSQYQEMLANNKNYYMQNYLNLFSKQIGATFVPHTKGGLLGTQLSGVLDSIQFSLATDNLANAPEIVRNANGNIVFNQSYCELGYYIEVYECPTQDKQKIADYLFKFGYNYGRLGRLADFDNIRHYFNYIEAQIDCINYPISNKEKDRLKYKLLNGVRFWNSDNIQYTYENYERSLDNE